MGRNQGQRRGRGRFRAQPVDPVTGKRVSISATTQAELESRLRRLRDVADGLRYGDIDEREAVAAFRTSTGQRLTVADAWARYRPGVSEASARIVDNHWKMRIGPEFATRVCTELDAATMAGWMQRLLAADTAQSTINGAYEALARALNLMVEAGLLQRLPWGRWRPPKVYLPKNPREAARSFDELVLICACARELDEEQWKRGHYSARYFATVFLGLTGMRHAEAAGLGWDRVEIDAEPFFVRIWAQAPKGWRERESQRGNERPTIPPKGGRRRTQELHPAAAVILRQQREQLKRFGRYRPDGPCFPGRGAEWPLVGRIVKPEFFRKAVAAAGLPNVKQWTPHSLRHSVATLEAIASGGDLRAVQARTGHTDLRVLEGYLHAAGRGMAASRLPDMPLALTAPPGGLLESPANPPGPFALPPPKNRAPVPVDAIASLASTAKAVEYQATVDEKKRTARREAERPFAELAREWIAAGRPGVRPRAVTDAVRRNYAAAYARERYRTGDVARAKEAGYTARRATLGAWGKALRTVERALGVA